MRAICASISLALCAACAADPDVDAAVRAQREALSSPRWVLVEMDGAPIGDIEGAPIDLHLEDDGRFHGHAGVNRYSGPWMSKRERDHAWSLLSKHANWWEPGGLKPVAAAPASSHLFYRIRIVRLTGRQAVEE